ncbi:ATP-binding protein [Paractinoplanes hotanensis]|uniref:Tetratricopeptide repeat protein n=1 Tax=Paractinoplanes hotanensis TaxID=2906497 RepID=A0ABT0YAM8_9ACTN|nr:tetratricopeptide repeat protein [Actinoplanes hotanensis]MCM4083092.1 tetratricopeptide repeat protein [Actinoplanes hotanensis]
MVQFGQLVAANRRRMGLTQEDVAAATGLSVRSIRDMESGRVSRPRRSTVRLLAEAFELSAVDRLRFVRAADPDAPEPLRERPHQLPLAVPGFVGRCPEIALLDADVAEQVVGPTVTVFAISGMPGVGKTALALHWAHRVRNRFPDGQLYVNLRGYDEGDAVDPADALRGFLEALGVPDGAVPASAEARIGLYRSLLTDRRMLIVLDNARDSAQVRSLLPGGGCCVVVVTSRDELSGLVAAEGAQPVRLDVLSSDESARLLGSRLGGERLAAEPAAVADIIAATGRLPLALSIVAARAALNPTFPLGTFAAGLRSDGVMPEVLTDGEVRAAFTWSYLALSPPAARLFCLLGLHPGPDLTADAAAALVGCSVRAITPRLRELTRLHLLREHLPGRYGFHDLLRAYAAELARSAGQRAARRRLFDHYLHSAFPAAVLLQPQWPAIHPVPPLPSAVRPVADDHDTALAWFSAEHRVLIRAVRQAAETGFEAYAWQLAWALTTYFAPRGLWQDQLTVQRVALAATERAGEVTGQAVANRLLARAETRLGNLDAAEVCTRRAIELYGQLDDPIGQAQTLHNYVELCYMRNRIDEGLRHGLEAIRLYRRAGNRAGEARTLNAMGWLYATSGDYRKAIESCTEALAQQRVTGDENGQAATLDSLGFAYGRLGEHERAAESFEQAVALFRGSADRYHEAETLLRLGETRMATGDRAAATVAWRRAAQIFDDLGDPAAEQARRQLKEAEEKAG